MSLPRHDGVYGRGGIAPLILNFGTRWRWMVKTTASVPRERTQVPMEYKAGWAPEVAWKLWRGEKYFSFPSSNTGLPSPYSGPYTHHAIQVPQKTVYAWRVVRMHATYPDHLDFLGLVSLRIFVQVQIMGVGSDSSVGIATRYGFGRSGDRIPVGGEIYCTRPDRPWGQPSLLYSGYRVIPGCKGGRRVPPTVVCHFVWSANVRNKETLARVGLLRQGRRNFYTF